MSIRFDFLRFAWLAAVSALIGGCAVAPEDDGAAAAAADGEGGVASTSQALVLGSDPDLAAFIIAVNDSEIAQARLAQTRAVDPDVLDFAQTMAADHAYSNQLAASLLARLGVAPSENPVSLAFSAQVAADTASLERLAGPMFDRAYLDVQVRVHYQVLSQLQAQLVASAPGFLLNTTELLPDLRAAMIRGYGAALSIQRFLGQPPLGPRSSGPIWPGPISPGPRPPGPWHAPLRP